MGLKYYLNLIKKESDIEAVKLKYFINTFLFAAYMILLIMYFYLRKINTVLSGVCGMAGLLSLLLYYIFNNRFQKFLTNIIENEPLDENDKTDAAFIAYRKGFIESKNTFTNKVFLISQIIIAVIFIVSLQLSIVLNITGNLDLSNQIYGIVSVMMWAYIALIIVFSFFSGMKNGVWYQNYIKELDIIKSYKAEQQTISGKPLKQRYKILEDKKPKEQIKYLFTDEELCKKFGKIQKLGSIGGFCLGGIFGLSLILFPTVLGGFGLSAEDVGFYSGIVLIVMLCAIVVFYAWNAYATKKIIKTQYRLLKDSGAENNLLIKLHELRMPFYKRWNTVFALGFVGAVASNTAFSALVAYLAETDGYGWIFFLLFLAEIITMFVMFSKAFAKLRFKMIAIEKEIDSKRELAAPAE